MRIAYPIHRSQTLKKNNGPVPASAAHATFPMTDLEPNQSANTPTKNGKINVPASSIIA
ncbi:hypothetical protein D9M72_610600 [compost metagenome]